MEATTVDEFHIKKALVGILTKSDLTKKTLAVIRHEVEESLGLSNGSLKPNNDFIIEVIYSFQSADFLESNCDINAKDKDQSVEEATYRQLTRFATAARKGPAIFKGLASVDITARCYALRRRLEDAGFKFQGAVPTDGEIKAVRKQSERAQELEGLDLSVIVSESRRRGTAPPQAVRLKETVDLCVKHSVCDPEVDKENSNSGRRPLLQSVTGYKRPLQLSEEEEEEEAEFVF